jgi:hypothetical protein
MIDRIAAEDFDSLPLHDFRNGDAELHDGLSPGICRPVRSGQFATVGAGFSGPVKRGLRLHAEVQICVLSSLAGIDAQPERILFRQALLA